MAINLPDAQFAAAAPTCLAALEGMQAGNGVLLTGALGILRHGIMAYLHRGYLRHRQSQRRNAMQRTNRRNDGDLAEWVFAQGSAGGRFMACASAIIGHRSRLRRLHGRSIPPALRPGRSGVRRRVYRTTVCDVMPTPSANWPKEERHASRDQGGLRHGSRCTLWRLLMGAACASAPSDIVADYAT